MMSETQQECEVSTAASGGGEHRICRICMEGDSEEALASPCACRGTQMFVHPSCLRRWQLSCNTTSGRTICPVCRTSYAAEFVIAPAAKETERPRSRADALVLLLLMLCSPLLLFGIHLTPAAARDEGRQDEWGVGTTSSWGACIAAMAAAFFAARWLLSSFLHLAGVRLCFVVCASSTHARTGTSTARSPPSSYSCASTSSSPLTTPPVPLSHSPHTATASHSAAHLPSSPTPTPFPSTSRACRARAVRVRVASLHTQVDDHGSPLLRLIRVGAPIRSLAAGAALVATDAIGGGVFECSVVLLTQHDAHGSAGYILNRPLDPAAFDGGAPLRHALAIPELVDPTQSPIEHGIGGPVDQLEWSVLHTFDRVPGATPLRFEGGEGVRRPRRSLYLGGDLSTIREHARQCVAGARWALRDVRAEAAEEVPLCVQALQGHAAWAAGQLEGEIRAGAWTWAAEIGPDLVMRRADVWPSRAVWESARAAVDAAHRAGWPTG